MDILIQPLLDKIRTFNTPLHIRYSSRTRASGKPEVPNQQLDQPWVNAGAKPMMAYVIIRREYSYLEPLIRAIFENAPDVNVFIDRRTENRPDGSTRTTRRERRRSNDRRGSTPMLDILINVET